jgi:hypothetical protein
MKEIIMPKKTIIIIMILFPLIVGLACRFTSSPDPTATPTEDPAVVIATEPVVEPTLAVPTRMSEQEETQEEPTAQPVESPKDLVVLEKSTWIQEESTVFVGYLIENPSSDILYEDIEFTIRIFGSAGNLIDTSYAYLPWFYPNTTYGIASTFWISDESVMVNSADVSWTFTGTSSPVTSVKPFTTESLIYWDNFGYPIVTGKIVNNSSDTYTDIRADILCYDSAGEMVGGGVAYLDFIHLNDYMGFTAYVDTFGEVASVEVFPTLSYSTTLIDKTDFVSEISILDDYFYEDDFGSLQGGLILKNETDYVLRNSYIYITFYDEDDNITTTGGDFINLLLPGDSLGITPWISFPPDGANNVRYDILRLPGEREDNYELDANPFRVNNTTVTGDSNDYVLVNFTNTYSKQVSEVDVYVLLFNAAGSIIGGGNTWTTEPTSAGGTGEVEVWVSYSSAETIDSIQAWVLPSYWTEFE